MTEELKKTPTIDRYTDDLTVAAAKNPDEYKAVARNQEIKQVIINLNRKTKNNPILIGEAGVGKTAIIEGLARLIALHKAGKQLEGTSNCRTYFATVFSLMPIDLPMIL